jgi:UDP-N-acetylglucosamine 2-epimerase
MYDAVLQFGELARQKTTTLQGLGLTPKSYLLATIHRAENTDFSRRLKTILEAFAGLDEPVIFPLHPRTRQRMIEYGLDSQARNITYIPPVGYLDMLALELNARLILTDSGGVQKDAYFFQVPCLTLRLETEWVETIQTGWNKIVAIDPDQIALAARRAQRPNDPQPSLFGDGQAAERIIELMKSWH